MSPLTKGSLRVAENQLEIQSLVVADLPTVTYVAQHDAADQLAAFANCYQLGARVIQFANDRLGATDICEQIDASAAVVRNGLREIGLTTQEAIARELKATFGKDGSMAASVEVQMKNLQRELEAKLDPEQANSITARVRAAMKSDISSSLAAIQVQFDPDAPGSVLNRLKADFDVKHRALDDKLGLLITQTAVRFAVGAEKLRGTIKGGEFEDVLETMVATLCRPRRDQLHRSSNETGSTPRCKRGDFVIEINPSDAGRSGLRLVIEAKNDQTRLKELSKELDEAMENRGASFAIGVTTNASGMPRGTPPVSFIGEDKVVVTLPDYDPETGNFDPVFIEVALEVARATVLSRRDGEAPAMDLAALRTHVNNAINVLARFSEVKKQLTAVTTSIARTDVVVDEVRNDVKNALQIVRDAIDAQLGAKGPVTGLPGQAELRLA